MERELLSVQECGELLGIGRSKTYELIAEGKLQVVRIGSRALVPRVAITELVERLRAEAETALS
jgi:excisionase family DNA binding protein